jgi:hypothetical protein
MGSMGVVMGLTKMFLSKENMMNVVLVVGQVSRKSSTDGGGRASIAHQWKPPTAGEQP